MAAMRVTCPECDGRLKLRTAIPAGKRIRCPKCEAVFAVHPDEDEDFEDAISEQPAPRRRRKAAAAGGRRPKRRPDYEDDFDDDNDSGEDDDFDERPRRRSRKKPGGKKRKKQGKGPLIGMICGGAVAVLALIFVVTAFLWPGFLRSSSEKTEKVADGKPAGKVGGPGKAVAHKPRPEQEVEQEALRFIPANVAVLARARLNDPTITSLVTFARAQMDKQPKADPRVSAQLMALSGSDYAFLAGTVDQKALFLFFTKPTFEIAQMQQKLRARQDGTVHGKPCYQFTDKSKNKWFMVSPKKDVLIVSNLSRTKFDAALAGKSVASQEMQAAIAPGRSHPLWMVAVNNPAVKQKLQAIQPFLLAAPQEVQRIFPVVQRMKSVTATLALADGAKMNLIVDCASEADANFMRTQGNSLWRLQLLPLVLGQRRKMLSNPGARQFVPIIDELTGSFKLAGNGSRVTGTLAVSKKTVTMLKNFVEQAAQQQGGPGQVNPSGPIPPGVGIPPGAKLPPGVPVPAR